MLIDAGLHDFEDFAPVPPGDYEFTMKEPVEITPVADEKTDIGGKQFQIVFKPEIVGGEQAGKKVRRMFSNKSKATRYFLRSFLEKLGVVVSGTGGFNTEDVLGRRFKAHVGERLVTEGASAGKKFADLDTESVVAL